MDITVIVEKTSEKRYSCFMASESVDKLGFLVTGTGNSANAAINDFITAEKEMCSYYQEAGKNYPQADFIFKFDVGSLFDYYPINITAFAKYIGMNASLLRQYSSGSKMPKEKTLERIKKGIDAFVETFNSSRLIDRPVLQYA